MNRDSIEMLNRVQRRGLTLDDALAVRRISMTLNRWYELECGDDHGCIERSEETGRPHWRSAWSGKLSRSPIPDRERGAIRRLDKLMARYPDLRYYLQTDPRGASVYLYRLEDLPQWTPIENCYSSIGTAVYR